MIVYRALVPGSGVYIGATKFTIGERKSRHHYDAKRGSRSFFHKAIRKYGQENILWEVLYEVETWEQAAAIEKTEISKARLAGKCYNLLDGGDGLIGIKHSEAWKEHLSQIMKGKKFSDDHKMKISKALTGMKRGRMTDAHRNKIRDKMIGKKREDPAYLEKLSNSLNDYYYKNPKLIFDVYTLDEVFVKRYYKIKDFLKEHGGCNTGVYNCIIGKKKTHRGLVFRKVTNATSATTTTVV